MVRIVVADGTAIDRGGLVGLLEDERDFEVVGEAATLPEAIEECRALAPDVTVLSLNLPGQEKESAILALRASVPGLRIVALSERGAEHCLVLNPPSRHRTPAELDLKCGIGMDCLQLAVTQGAHATVRRSADPEDLFRAIRAVASGSAWYDPTTVPGLVQFDDQAGAPGTAARLSERELEVAALIAEGLSNKEISSALAIGEPTVKKHVGQILEKLGTADRLQAGLLLARNPQIFKR
jgi:DNA-binding NarL/FixJ family response regulator